MSDSKGIPNINKENTKEENKLSAKDRWKKNHPEKQREYNRKYYKRSADKAERTKAPWTNAEIKMIMEHKKPDAELAEMLGRSMQAIQVKRAKVKGDY